MGGPATGRPFLFWRRAGGKHNLFVACPPSSAASCAVSEATPRSNTRFWSRGFQWVTVTTLNTVGQQIQNVLTAATTAMN
jgi:hypothetical protein